MAVNVANSANNQTGENRFAIIIICVLGATIALSPIAVALGSGWLVPWFIAGVAIITTWLVAWPGYLAGTAPGRTLLEYILATLSAAFGYQIVMGMALIPAVLVFWTLRLASMVGSWFGFSGQLPASNTAWWTGVVCSAFFVSVAASITVDKVRNQLFAPKFAGRSAFYDIALRGRKKLTITIAIHLGIVLSVAIGVLWIYGKVGGGFWLFFTLYLAACASQIVDLGDHSISETKAITALTRLFEALGCEVIREPKTEDRTVDRLLSGLDIVAHDKERVWGVTVKGRDEHARPIEWVAGAGLLSAVRAYREKRTEFAGIEPVMVIVDAEVDRSLESFSQDEGMRIVRLDLPQIEKVIATASNGDLREMAEQLFVREPTQVGVSGEGALL